MEFKTPQEAGAHILYMKYCISRKAILKWANKFKIDLSDINVLRELGRGKILLDCILNDWSIEEYELRYRGIIQ